MLGPCWHIFLYQAPFLRSWLVLDRLLHFLAHFGRFFRALGRPRLDFGYSGVDFGAFQPTFFNIFPCWQTCDQKPLGMQKPMFFLGFCEVLTYCEHIVPAQKTIQNRFRILYNTPSHQDCVPNLCGGWFRSGLELYCASHGWLLVALGRLLVSLGLFLGVS